MHPTPTIMGRHSLAPSLDKEEVGEPNKGKCSYLEILAGMNQTIFEDGKPSNHMN
jgi:hypothetical protein